MKLNPRRLSATLAALALTGAIVAVPLPALAETITVDESAETVIEAPAEAPIEAPVEGGPEEPAEVTSDTPTEDAPEPPADGTDNAPTDSAEEVAPGDAPAEPHQTPAAPAAVVDGVGFTIDRAWVDPTVLNDSDRPFFTATMLFPPIEVGVHTVAHGTAPAGLAEATHCQIATPTNGVTGVTCQFYGEVTPGDSTVSIRVRSEAGDDYSASLPVTMCPETGCSPLFEVAAVQSAAVEVCPGDDITINGSYDFNVAWNASGAALGEEAPEGLTLDQGSVRDGGAFSIAGAVSEPGEHSIPVIVTDEFGGEHATSVDVRITEPVPGVCGVALELASTGINATSAVNLSMLAFVLVLGGALAMQRTSRQLS